MVNDEEPTLTPAEAATVLLDGDRASARMGMRLDSVGPGAARMSMTVADWMVNGYGSIHGGLLSAFADSAFAVACNSHGIVTVAAGYSIEFLEPAYAGEELVAEATEVARRGRSGVYDVTVRRGETVVATFRGRSRSLGRPLGRSVTSGH